MSRWLYLEAPVQFGTLFKSHPAGSEAHLFFRKGGTFSLMTIKIKVSPSLYF